MLFLAKATARVLVPKACSFVGRFASTVQIARYGFGGFGAMPFLLSARLLDQFLKRPKPIRDPGCHGRGDAQAPMHAYEIVMGEMQGYRRLKFSTFLLKPLVRRVNRRMDMRMVRFCRSTRLVEMWA
jgi:hypothetical protein